jgi:hypothetical protein
VGRFVDSSLAHEPAKFFLDTGKGFILKNLTSEESRMSGYLVKQERESNWCWWWCSGGVYPPPEE